MTNPNPSTIVFDIGGVLLDWDPRYLYRKLFDSDEAMEAFLSDVCSQDWNERMDAGLSFDDGVAELTEQHPHHSDLIHAYHHRWIEMVPRAIEGTAKILEEAQGLGHPVYAITNFNAEKLELASELYPFLRGFDGMIVSSEVRMMKPDPAIFLEFLRIYGKRSEDCVFIDDRESNVAAARDLGMHGLHFTGPTQLRTDLAALGLL
ncbi:MAG: HAD family phosphatase [Pseudomonadota bacterium]